MANGARSLSRSAIDKLGGRLRGSARIAPGDRELLRKLLRDHLPPMLTVGQRVAAIAGEHAAVTSRPKRTRSIIEKLARQPTLRLSQMQDIASVRVVDDMTLSEQDRLVDRIIAALHRRRRPVLRRRPLSGGPLPGERAQGLQRALPDNAGRGGSGAHRTFTLPRRPAPRDP